jgi:phytoene synthase
MRLMPKRERAAMFAIYNFCRAVDDIADDTVRPRGEREMALNGWRRDIEALYEGRPSGRAAFPREMRSTITGCAGTISSP